MKNADLPAMPFVELDAGCSVSIGLTKREIFAMHFHAALLTKYEHSAFVCDEAVREADALLEALEK